ncbi:MAG TPA: dTDP-4-dehydrorhamnose reductase [Solirubrobacteraceae bacterium]|nr:dTDP-4-dehydrorhamnose reductase [Solirubrobacteraceae bacterium]
MRILITGAGGMLGNDVIRAAEAGGHEPMALARPALDITDAVAVAAAVRAAAPDVVVNCAAWTDVDGAEDRFAEALAINGAGAGHVAAAAAKAGAWTIHVSSDYVFDGEKSEPYVESDPVDPVSAYGRSKLAGEQEVVAATPDRHTIVRSSWLFGAHGRCFPKTILRLAAEREELNVVSDQIGCPTFTGHLAGAIVGLAEDPLPGVRHVAGTGPCSWFQFAEAIVAAGGARCQVRPIPSEQYPTPARRPAYSVLESERGAPRLPEWERGLHEFLSELSGVAA